MKRSSYIRQLKKRRKHDVSLIREFGYFIACDGNVYKADPDKLWHPNFVDGNPFRSYECEGISLNGQTRHECDIDHCLVDVLNETEAKNYVNPFI